MLEMGKETRRRIREQARRDMAWLKDADLLDILKWAARETRELENDLAQVGSITINHTQSPAHNSVQLIADEALRLAA
jgi:hypothetical protein